MKVLDKELDNQPTERMIADMAELRIRNLLCFSELQSFNDSGTWLKKHPLITHQSLRFRLEELYRDDNVGFLKKYNDCCNNIKRYNSFIKNEKRIEKRDSDKELLEKHKEQKIIFESIIKDNKL